MARKNKKWTPKAKFNIAIEVIKSVMTLNELCNKYQVAPSQAQSWKKELLTLGPRVFEKEDKAFRDQLAVHEKLEKELYEKIGKLTVEHEFLKKSWEKFQGNIEEK